MKVFERTRDVDTLRDEILSLMQECIRNRCVNPPGGEMRSIRTIDGYLQSYGVETEVFETAPERGNLLAEIQGTGGRPSLMFGPGHVDVVPVDDASMWEVPPFDGVVKDGCIWGRGAMDMLFIVATQAVAFAHLHRDGFRPRGSLKLLVVADEEAGGEYGAGFMVKNHPEKVKVDYLLTEAGGFEVAPKRVAYMYAEKGASPMKLRVKGEEKHGSMPYGTDNAVVTMAKAVKRLQDYDGACDVSVTSLLLEGLGVSRFRRWLLRRPSLLPRVLRMLSRSNLGMARLLHSLSYMTISPNICKGGTKINVVPCEAEVEVDIRTLPGQDESYVMKHLRAALGDLNDKIEISPLASKEGGFASYGNTSSPRSELITVVEGVVKEILGADYVLVPMVLPGASDSRYFRGAFGTQAYGLSLFDNTFDATTVGAMAHGNDERIPLGTLDLTYDFYTRCARLFLT